MNALLANRMVHLLEGGKQAKWITKGLQMIKASFGRFI